MEIAVDLIIKTIERAESALNKGNYEEARNMFDKAHRIYAMHGKEESLVSHRMNDIEQEIFYR